MNVKVSDYIVDFFIKKGITDVFGYPGGMVTHLMEAFRQKENLIKAHVNYHEQASAFSACGFAQVCNRPGVAYATSGPGATNLITGICNAYFDSIPTIFITGQVNTYESKKGLQVRQRGFQETDIVEIVKNVTKYCSYVSDANAIKAELEKAWYIANEGRKGPVLLDIPMDIFRSIVDTELLSGYMIEKKVQGKIPYDQIEALIKEAKRPVILLGAGCKEERLRDALQQLVEVFRIPVVTSMVAFDVLEYSDKYNYGFIGAYGNRAANFIVAKCDLILAIGTRMDVRQVGAKKENFAPNAVLIRVDIDAGEFSNHVKEDELQIQCDAGLFLEGLLQHGLIKNNSITEWINICNEIKSELDGIDSKRPNDFIKTISKEISENVTITTDVGQNQVWVAQSFEVKKGQKVLLSGGHGAMGYSLPAAIGAYYANKNRVISFNGDGGIQMNIQELQFIARERLPITVVIVNNQALGMIRHFQEMYFENHYYQTVPQGGYDTPDFSKIAEGYNLKYSKIEKEKDIYDINWNTIEPKIVEIFLPEKTYVFPKLEFGKPNQDQEPLLNRKLYNRLMEL